MNKICIHSLVFLAGALGCAALSDEAIDSPSKELLASYTYQPETLVLPSNAFPTDENPAVFKATVATDFTTTKPAQYNWRDLEEGMAQDKERQQSHVLYAWDWRENSQWEFLGRPDLQYLTVPWSPTMPTDTAPSAMDVDNASSRIQVRFPLVSLAF